MSNIDNRIVKMEFDNSKFNGNAQSTMSLLDKLKDKLNFTGAANSLSNLTKSAKQVDMSSLASGVSEVASRFSIMDVVGVTALVNIANTAVNTGKQLLSSLTLDPIMSGFQEYELKLGATQTIMAGTGESIEKVSGYLAELNEYSDRTIYSFSDMTQNIGKFTNAGVKLEDAVLAIKGISNAAAVSGANAQEASHAMYNFAQAISSGHVKLIDWKSIEVANMGTQAFKKQLLETALALGTVKKAGDKYVSTTRNMKGKTSEAFDSVSGFTDNLQYQWMTTEVLVETLKKYTDETTDFGKAAYAAAGDIKSLTQMIGVWQEAAQSGWAETWELLFGNLEEAKIMWTSVSKIFEDMISSSAEYRNEQLKIWKDLGGRDAMIKGFMNIIEAIGKIIKPINEAFREIFDPWNGDRLANLSKGFEWFTSKLIIGDKTIEGIKDTFKGLFTIGKTILSVIKPLGAALYSVFTVLSPLVSIIPRLTGFVGDLVTKIVSLISSSINTSGLFDKLSSGVEWLADAIRGFVDISDGWLNKGLDSVGGYVTEFMTYMGDVLTYTGDKVVLAKKSVNDFNDTYKPLEKAGIILGNAIDLVKIGLDKLSEFVGGFVDITKKAFSAIGNFFIGIKDAVSNSGFALIDIFNTGLLGGLLFGVKKMIDLIKNFGNNIMQITGGLANAISGVGRVFNTAADALSGVRDVLETYQKSLKSEILKNIAISVALLAGSIWLLTTIDPGRLIPALTAMGVLLFSVKTMMDKLLEFDHSKMSGVSKTIGAMIGVSAAMVVFAITLKILSSIDTGRMVTSVLGLAAVMGGLYVFLKETEKLKLKPDTIPKLTNLASSMVILSIAFKMLSTISVGDLIKSISAMGAALGAIYVFLQATNKLTDPTKVTASLISLSTSMLLLAGALALFGFLNIGTLVQGLIVLTTTLTIFTHFINNIKKDAANMLQVGGGILLIASAMITLSMAIGILGNMNLSTLAKGLLTIGAALALIAYTSKLMPVDMLVKAAGVAVMSLALISLAAAIGILGSMELSTILKGIAGIAGIILVLTGISVVAAAAAPAMLAFAGGLAAVGAAVMIVGGGLMLLSAGITMMSGSIIASGGAFLALVTSLAAAIPILTAGLALGIASFITTLGYNAEPLGRAITSLIMAAYQTMIDTMPKFIEVITLLLKGILQAAADTVPQMIETIFVILNELLARMNEFLPLFAEMLILIMQEGLRVIVSFGSDMVTAVLELISNIMTALADNVPVIAAEGARLLIDLFAAMLNEFAVGIPKVADATLNIIEAIISEMANSVIRISNACWDFVISIIKGITTTIKVKLPELRKAITELGEAMLEELKACIPSFGDIGKNIMEGLANGIKGAATGVKDALIDGADWAVGKFKSFFGIHSPSRLFMSFGEYTMEGFAIGISDNVGMVGTAVTSAGDTAVDVMTDAMNQLNDVVNSDMDSNPVITPVLDLSNVQNGYNMLNNMATRSSTLSMNANVTNKQHRQSVDQLPSAQVSGSTSNTINNTFNITGDNPTDIANEVSRILQMQVERRDAIWA